MKEKKLTYFVFKKYINVEFYIWKATTPKLIWQINWQADWLTDSKTLNPVEIYNKLAQQTRTTNCLQQTLTWKYGGYFVHKSAYSLYWNAFQRVLHFLYYCLEIFCFYLDVCSFLRPGTNLHFSIEPHVWIVSTLFLSVISMTIHTEQKHKH